MNEFGIPFVGPLDFVDEQGRKVDHKEFNPEKGMKERIVQKDQYPILHIIHEYL